MSRKFLGKLEFKSDEGILFGYSTKYKVYRIYNSRTIVVEEVIHVSFMTISLIKNYHS